MDAFAVSVTNGLVIERLRFRFALKMAVCFGVALAVMPLIGYMLGYRLTSHSQVEPYYRFRPACICGYQDDNRYNKGLLR